MKANKSKRLKTTGWNTGNAEDFLQLSNEEARFVTLKLSLGNATNKSCAKRKLSQPRRLG